MSQFEVERFLGRLITDLNFRTMAANSLEQTINMTGFVLSNDEKTYLGNIDFSRFETVADGIDDSIKRS